MSCKVETTNQYQDCTLFHQGLESEVQRQEQTLTSEQTWFGFGL